MGINISKFLCIVTTRENGWSRDTITLSNIDWMILSYTSDDVVLLCFLCSLSFKSSYAKFLLKQIFFAPKDKCLEEQVLWISFLRLLLASGGIAMDFEGGGGRGAGGGKHFHGSSSPRAQGRGRGRLKTFSSLNVLAGGHDLSALQGLGKPRERWLSFLWLALWLDFPWVIVPIVLCLSVLDPGALLSLLILPPGLVLTPRVRLPGISRYLPKPAPERSVIALDLQLYSICPLPTQSYTISPTEIRKCFPLAVNSHSPNS